MTRNEKIKSEYTGKHGEIAKLARKYNLSWTRIKDILLDRKTIKPLKSCIRCCKSTRNPKYCSKKCAGLHKWDKSKIYFEKYGCWGQNFNNATIHKKCKRYLLEIRGHQCEICKNKKWQGQPIPLILDHISGNSDDNSLSNLRLVCGNCDMQLPTYKSKNYGNGRAFRRKRYKENKSY